MPKALISPSLLASDLSSLKDECERLIKKGSDYLHLDVMDGHFVPNLTFGPPVIKWLRKAIPREKGFFDVHLMICEPIKWVKRYFEAGADLISFHPEACKNDEEVLECLKLIKSFGIKSCLAVKPKTKISDFFLKCIDEKVLDMILVMTVEPGFGGQKFMEDMMEKVKLIRKKYPNFDIQVDGGINVNTIEIVAKAGANVIVSGSGILKAKDEKEAIEKMRNVIKKYN